MQSVTEFLDSADSGSRDEFFRSLDAWASEVLRIRADWSDGHGGSRLVVAQGAGPEPARRSKGVRIGRLVGFLAVALISSAVLGQPVLASVVALENEGCLVAPSQLAGAACSFSGSTAVLMADGSAKPIAEIEIGDFVLAEDPETGETGARKVTRLWVHEHQITDLELDDGMDPASTRTTTAYNLTVDDIHTYFVRIGTEDILVHNNNGLCDLDGRPFLRDFATKNTINRSANYASEGHARAVARTNPVDIGNNKLRSANGVWEYRAKPVDTSLNHVHLERLNPATGEVLENWYFCWPGGG